MWSKDPASVIHKLKYVKECIISWNTLVFGNIEPNIQSLEAEIERLDANANTRSFTESELDERKSAQMSL